MNRSSLTLLTVSSLYGAYRAYAAVVAPLTTPVIQAEQPGASIPVAEIAPLSISGRIARTYLADQPWAAEAKYQWQRGEESFLFFQRQMRIEDDTQNKMRVSPFALVWIDSRRRQDAAYTLVCESALIEFESKLQIGESNPGRIVWGQLYGDVRILGPDGLAVLGQNFILNEESQRLHSDDPVQFSYGPQSGKVEQVRGHAKGVDIKLKETRESLLGNDMPRIGGLRQVALHGNVTMDLAMEDHERPVPVKITCQHGFTYEVDGLVATFNEDVRVRAETHKPDEPEQYDWLRCDRLELTFEEDAEEAQGGLASRPSGADGGKRAAAKESRAGRAEQLGISLDVSLRHLRAVGNRVVIGSEENDLTARMEDLFYDLVARTVEMRSNTGRVEAHYRDDVLECPFIRLHHDDDSRIDAAECWGAGSIIRREPDGGQVEVESTWTKHLTLAPDPETGLDVLEISGDGRVVQPQQRTGIVADTLKVWLDSDRLQSADGNLRSSLTGATAGGDLPLTKVIASADVALVSPKLHLETQYLKADFVAGTVVEPSRPSAGSGGDGTSNSDQDDGAEQPVVIAAESVDAQLVFDSATERTDVLHLNAAQKVVVSRAAPESQQETDARGDTPFTIEADELELRNQGGSHVLRLTGQPARIRHPEAEIEGNELFFDRGGNLAMVPGTGALSLLVESDLEGQTLDVPELLTVRWEDQMKFDGQRAEFFGRVRTTLADSNMFCERMTVSLDRRLSFNSDRSQAEHLEIARIHCQEGVEGEYIDWYGTTLVGIRKVQVAEFTVERTSGDIRAQGPGRIDDWQRGGHRRHVRIDPTAVASANAAATTSSLPWEYTRVRFAGDMTGNQRDRFVTLHDRVRVMHGPVENALEVIDRDVFSEETERARNSIWMGSDIMQVRLVPGADAEAPETVSVLARDNAELEGKVFRGRADSISYDESKEMFTLKGRGTEASLWHQERPGSPDREASAKTIQFVPSKRELTLDGTRGIRGAR